MKALEYSKWSNFTSVIEKAKSACELSKKTVYDHFTSIGKMVDIGSKSSRNIEDYMLPRYACYLIVQNPDPRKQIIAFGQTYFAIQTRKIV